MSLLVSVAATVLAAIALPQAAAVPAAPPIGAVAPAQATPPQLAPQAEPPLEPPLESRPVLPAPEPGPAADQLAPAPLPPPAIEEQGLTQEEIIVRARGRGYAPDPLRAANAESFKATMAVDKAVIGPVSRAYKKTVPTPVRKGVHNFLYNLREPVVFLNYLLQLKIGKAAETAARFLLNSTVGVAGVLDVAKTRPFKLPRRSNGFANTLGFYGVKPGPFLFLPLVGATTVRDLFGGVVDRLVVPVAAGSAVTKPEFTIPAAVLGSLDRRAEFDEAVTTLQGAKDPYATSRDFYLQRRQGEIDRLHGRATPGVGSMIDPPKGPIVIDGQPVAPAPAPTPVPHE